MAVVAIADSNYLSRCSTMVESADVGHLATVLALDDGVQALQTSFPELRLAMFWSYLGFRPEVAEQISQRSTSEQIFSVGPSFLLSQSESVTAEGWLVYADSDLVFFEPLQTYLESLPECNVVIAPIVTISGMRADLPSTASTTWG